MRKQFTVFILALFVTSVLATNMASAQVTVGAGSHAPTVGTWLDKTAEPVRTYFSTTASDGNYLYVLGGNSYDGTNYIDVSNLQRYNPATDSWTQLATPLNLSSITSAAACYMNGKIYVFGGQANGSYSNLARIYTIAANSWADGPAYSGDGYIWATAVCDPHTNRAFVLGGETTGGQLNNNRIFNAATNAWAADGAVIPGTSYAAAAGLLSGGRVILTGGYLNGSESNATYIYSISHNSWAAVTNIPNVSTHSAYGVGADGKFYVAGGSAGGGATNGVRAYDPITNTWLDVPAMNWPVDYTVGGFVGSLLHVVGGVGFSNDPGCANNDNHICNDNQQLNTDCTNNFVDLNGNIFYPAIHNLYCRGVANGTDATHFSPAATSTRAQFAKVTVLGFGVPLANPGTPSFTDVPSNYFAYQFIEGGVAAGILSGYDTATCNNAGIVPPCYIPNRAITRGQITKIVVSAAGYPLINPPAPTYTDVAPGSIFYQFIETAHAKGVVNGYADSTFRPNNNVQRDQMCQIVYKGITTP